MAAFIKYNYSQEGMISFSTYVYVTYSNWAKCKYFKTFKKIDKFLKVVVNKAKHKKKCNNHFFTLRILKLRILKSLSC